MLKIAFIGAPSTGKSTTSNELRGLLRGKTNVIEYISAGQFLKANGFGINEDGTDVTGRVCVFFHKLSVATMNLFESKEIVILPRTIIDPVAYDNVPITEEEVDAYFSNVDFVFYLPIETEMEPGEHRTKSEDYRSSMDKKLLELCEKFNIKYETLSGNPKEKAQKILKRIEGVL